MSGTAIIRELLANHAPVTAIVPAKSIFAGAIPQATTMPTISVRSISGYERPTTARNLQTKMITERIQVTCYAKDYPMLDRLLKACSLGSGVHTGIVVGFRVRNIWPDNTGPYIEPGDDKIHEQSRDFMVTFVEAN